jgi:isocitrate lyase
MKNLEQSNYSSALNCKRFKSKVRNTWNAINPESAARMVTQNRFKTGLDIAKYTAAIMRKTWQSMMQMLLNTHSH